MGETPFHGGARRGRTHQTVFTAPHDIIVEIISRLPVKTLCRFKCVSKLWLSTISSPQFARTHLDLASRNNTQKQKLLYWADGQVCRIDWESISADDVLDKGLVADVLENSLKDHPCLLTFRDVLCSNGLVCVVDKDKQTVSVINPCTGKSRKVLLGSGKHGKWFTFVYGFGYSSKSDDYKLVIMDSETVSMYSLRSDTWTKFTPPLHYRLPMGVSGVPLNGALHWVGSSTFYDDGDKCVIVSFDLHENSIREMPVPALVHDIFDSSLGVINGCLCAHHWDGMADAFWVMREYNNGKSWSTSLVPLDTLWLAKKRVNVPPKIVLCNFENGTHGIPIGDKFKVGTYVESIISPNLYVGLML